MSNEITAVPRLLELLELAGAVVTLDAMHCQTATAEAIIGKGADYILPVKKNQPTLHESLAELFAAYGENGFQAAEIRKHQKSEVNRTRKETRITYVAPAPKSVIQQQWPGVQSVGMIYRRR